MEYSLEERCRRIIDDCLAIRSCDPVRIFDRIAQNDCVRIHGPEHHVLDGASLLTAFYCAGGPLPDLKAALYQLLREGLRMPGAVCGKWGVCGAVMSIGAALAIIDGTGPLTADGSWESHMRYTAAALNALADIGGPRCCKRDGFIALRTAAGYIAQRYHVQLETKSIVCRYSSLNPQCISGRCPFHRGPGAAEEG